MKLTIAFLQLLPTGCLNGNLEKGISACRQAKEKGADIAVFPEMWSCGYAFPHDETSLRECAISCDSPFVQRFSELAAELDMAIAITLLEQHEPKPRNTVCLFDRHGRLQYRYSKVHICDFGEADDEGVLDAGDDFFVADLDTKGGAIKVGSMICYDREFPESARILTATAIQRCSTVLYIFRSSPVRGIRVCLKQVRQKVCTWLNWTWICCAVIAAVKYGAAGTAVLNCME